ncbi:MAG: hypothetical protein M3512_05675, partial [Bacteroidota bacterium]|nr:hypothetical protein [Bacteroidota bacterium]
MFRRFFILIICIKLFLNPSELFGQESAPGIIITCPAAHDSDAHSYIDPQIVPANARTTESATFIVDYIGFSEEAQIAFQHAVNIWQTKIHSSVPIRIRATWKSLETSVLGSAGATTVYRNFDGAPKMDTWYPVALAEKLSRQELNGPLVADIVADFNSDAKWYLGTDARPPAGITDFVTVVLHEIAHGLGFVSSMDVSNGQGSWGTSNFPLTYDHFLENNSGQNLVNTPSFTNPSTALGNQLISNNIFFRGPVIANRLSLRPKIYAPSPYDIGSSISHLDESTYPTGSPNSLMTPKIGRAEAIHEPGQIVLEMFAEMGWQSTYIDISGNKDVEDFLQPISIKAKIFTENSIRQETLILYYSTNNFATTTQVVMQPTDTPKEYVANIAATVSNITISYYIRVRDNFNREFSTPSNAPQSYHQIRVGPDFVPPIINHDPLEYIFINELVATVSAIITDNVGIRDVTVEYSINDRSQ